MPPPKSVTKIKKDGVEFISKVNYTNYAIEELSRAALKDVAKLLRKRIKDATPVETGVLKRNVGTWVKKNPKTGEHVLQVGVYNRDRAKRKGYTYAYHAHLVEFGTAKMKAANGGRGFIKPTVQDSVDDIRRIEGQYLSAIEDENRALGLIDEEEEIGDD